MYLRLASVSVCHCMWCVCVFACVVCLGVYDMSLCGVYGFNLDRQNCLGARAAAFYVLTFIMTEVWYNLDLI